MAGWVVKLWETELDGSVHSYSGSGESVEAFEAAAEALAHFSAAPERPAITLDSRLDVEFEQAVAPDQAFTVRAILDYVRRQPELLSVLQNPHDIQVLADLASELGV
jgi:hypothetical protein